MSSAKAMYDKLQTVKTSGSKTPISDFKSVDSFADKKYIVDGFRATSTFGSLAGTWKWVGGVLAPNGKIYGIPSDATTNPFPCDAIGRIPRGNFCAVIPFAPTEFYFDESSLTARTIYGFPQVPPVL